MRKIRRTSFLAAAFLIPLFACPPLNAFPTKPVDSLSEVYIPAVGSVTKTVLSNGLTVLVAPSSSSDLVTLDAWVGAGTRRETPEINGAAHFMEHLLFKGTPTRKAGAIDQQIEDLGGSFNASTSYDWAHFYVTVASADAEPALAILSDALMNAQLRQDDIDTERPVILSEMAQEESSPGAVLMQAFNKSMFGDEAYGRPLLGSADIVAQISRQSLLKFYKTYYVPSNVTMVVSGNITNAAAVSMVQSRLGSWAGKTAPSEPPVPAPKPAQFTTKSVSIQGAEAYVLIGFPAPAVSVKPDAYAMDVLLTLLGQAGNNRLNTDLVVNTKKALSVSANYLTQKDPGSLTITATCTPGEVNGVTDAILAEVTSLRQTTVPTAELDAAKHALLASYLFDVQTTQGRADALGFYSTIDSYAYDVDYIKNFESVTSDDVKAVALRYLDPSTCTIVTSVPETQPDLASAKRESSLLVGVKALP